MTKKAHRIVSDALLLKKAAAVAKRRSLSDAVEVGSVGSALVTDKGNIYVGVNIDASCGMGFCAEHTAIGDMLTRGESHIKTIVAIHERGTVYPPCGRCRELIYQIDHRNLNTRVLLGNDVMRIRDLLPAHWLDIKRAHKRKKRK